MEDLLSKSFPRLEEHPTTFLEIAQMPHYEVVISRIYNYYLQDNPEHGFKDLLLRSLIDSIKNKGKKLQIPREWTSQTEVATNKGKRIDILIDWVEGNVKWSIIIENKIFHIINNDLEDYFQSSPALEDNKIGTMQWD